MEFIRATWRETPNPIQVTTKIMVSFGTLLILFGSLGDVAGTWDHAPFWTNLLSSLAGFLYAVPLGLIILHQISMDRTAAQQQRSLVALTRQLCDHLLNCCNALRVQSQNFAKEESPSTLFFKLRGETLDMISRLSEELGNNQVITKHDLLDLVNLGRRCCDAWTWTWALPSEAYSILDKVRRIVIILRDYVEPQTLETSGPVLIDSSMLSDLEGTLDWIAPRESRKSVALGWPVSARMALDALETHGEPSANSEALTEAILKLTLAIESSEEANDMLEELISCANRIYKHAEIGVADRGHSNIDRI
ncbi:hypothetical protein [Streptosporangium longisporum]